MRKIIFIIILVSCLFNSYAQDRIITTDGDTIICKITQEKNNFIYYSYKQDEQVRNTMLPLSRIISYTKDYVEYSDFVLDIPLVVSEEPKCRLALNLGWAYLVGKTEDKYGIGKDYINSLKSGFGCGLDFHFHLKNYNYLGLEYSLFHKSKKQEVKGVTVDDNINIHFIGPSYHYYFFNKNKNNAGGFILGLASGYVGYKNKAEAGKDDGKITGNTVGYTLTYGYDFGISKSTAFYLKLSLLYATLGEITYKSGSKKDKVKLESDERENISHLKLTLGLRFFP